MSKMFAPYLNGTPASEFFFSACQQSVLRTILQYLGDSLET